jgi:hypothetical protein
MLTVALPSAVAHHNSWGAPHTHVTDPNEYDAESGLLVPDIPHAQHPQKDEQVKVGDETSPYHLEYHEDLEEGETSLPARPAPYDQSGQGYTDCTPASDYEDEAGNLIDKETYNEDLRSGEACYVGYFDQIVEYYASSLPLLLIEQPSDTLYAVNPAEGDEYCRGEEDTNNVTGNDDVDTTVTNVERVSDQNCQGGNHPAFWSGDLMLDVKLVESPVATVAEETGSDTGSGGALLDGFLTQYTFIFGQPHPDVEPIEKSNPVTGADERFEAGSGPFGPNPLEFGNPLHDLTNACGDRTHECKLLEPDDVIEYDPWTWDEERFPDKNRPEQPRVCAFLPQYTFSPAGGSDNQDRDQLSCGSWGEQIDQFFSDISAGGFNAPGDTGTWYTNLPGWAWGVIYVTIPQDQYGDVADYYWGDEDNTLSLRGTGGDYPGFINYYAVNPISPQQKDDLRCIEPNILASGDDSVLKDAGVDTKKFQDPGIYGTYQAGAIDADIYPFYFRDDIEETAAPVEEDIQSTTDPAADLADQTANDVGNVDDAAQDAIDDATPPEVDEALDRAGPYESGETPDHAKLGKDNQRSFEGSISAGLACNAAGELVFRPNATTLKGGLNFQAGISQESDQLLPVNTYLKDPTVLDEGLPAPESETDEGYWQTDLYSFGGNAFGFLDLTQNEEFDTCPGSNLGPGEDLCPWESLWDAYNDQCANFNGKACRDILQDNGYNVDGVNGPESEAGVGLYFVAHLEGPALVTAETGTTDTQQLQDQTQLLGGTGDKVCVVGTSQGFHEKLPNHVKDAETPVDLPGELCDGDTDESTLVTDAFDTQSGVNRGGFSADVELGKIVPTPQATDEGGVTESLCVSGVWSVADEVVDTNTTQEIDYALDTTGENNIRLEAGQVHQFSHWQSLETGTDTQGDRAVC